MGKLQKRPCLRGNVETFQHVQKGQTRLKLNFLAIKEMFGMAGLNTSHENSIPHSEARWWQDHALGNYYSYYYLSSRGWENGQALKR